MGPRDGTVRKVGATVCSLPVTHTDVQVLQEELQQTSAQAQRPHPLVAPRGLDPRAQVLGKMGVSHGCPGGQPRRQEPVHSGQVSVPARPPFQASGASRTSGWVTTAAAHPCPAGLDHTHGPPGGPRASWAYRGMECSQGGRQHGHHLPIPASRWPQTIRSSHLRHLQGLWVPAP